eukprot:gene9525-biopygen6204
MPAPRPRHCPVPPGRGERAIRDAGTDGLTRGTQHAPRAGGARAGLPRAVEGAGAGAVVPQHDDIMFVRALRFRRQMRRWHLPFPLVSDCTSFMSKSATQPQGVKGRGLGNHSSPSSPSPLQVLSSNDPSHPIDGDILQRPFALCPENCGHLSSSQGKFVISTPRRRVLPTALGNALYGLHRQGGGDAACGMCLFLFCCMARTPVRTTTAPGCRMSAKMFPTRRYPSGGFTCRAAASHRPCSARLWRQEKSLSNVGGVLCLPGRPSHRAESCMI